MISALQRAFDCASALPEPEQEALAALIMAEIEEERRWEDLFASRPDVLESLAREALREHDEGRTQPLSLDIFEV